MEFPYKEMVKEWNGSRVHVSEFEEKHPQLEPKTHRGDPQGLQDARPARTEPATQNLLPGDPFSLTSGSGTVTVTEPSHGRSTSDILLDLEMCKDLPVEYLFLHLKMHQDLV